MSTEQAAALLTAIASLLGALAWPVIIMFMLVRFHTPISGLIAGLQQVTIKGMGAEITATRAAVVANVASAETLRDPPGQTPEDTQARATAIANLITPDAIQEIPGRRVLWVDDRPENNRFEAAALRALGLRVVLTRTTEEALDALARDQFDLVISDMGRADEATAGYDLLNAIRRHDSRTPFVIYAGSNSLAHREEAVRRGAQGSTNRPEELLRLVISLVRTRR